jgi:hypothetical protein
MRRAVALAVLALVLSGCSAGTSDDPTPPNADPNGSVSSPPVSYSTSSGPPTASNSSSSSATSTYPAPQGSVSFAPHDAEDSTTAEAFPSLLVSGHLQGSGPQLRVEATANNMGERSYRIPDGTCQEPWSESMVGPDGQAVQLRQPASTCAAFSLTELEAHGFTSTELTWNGTLWDAAAGAFATAPKGDYEWTVAFDVYSGGSGSEFDDHATLTLHFDVHVP